MASLDVAIDTNNTARRLERMAAKDYDTTTSYSTTPDLLRFSFLPKKRKAALDNQIQDLKRKRANLGEERIVLNAILHIEIPEDDYAFLKKQHIV
ncbi:hypothetical protein GS501_01400 [Saccharibacter sp. 17.LH.SD]|uniref:hypothetical protein n=1 Tax=Saccharibacter sp. 17.LH.SD TaxID=2689393 RepID=UPI001368A0AF|nr:hypothetical protein [Saccharibacter sp. 17.LH.SD]MXV43712.1 hypothetical protein [Saccharibacter sp. 17.LH.SD]